MPMKLVVIYVLYQLLYSKSMLPRYTLSKHSKQQYTCDSGLVRN
jgi:hypothetical protein